MRQLLSQKHSGAIQAAFLEANPTLTKETLSKNFKLMASYTTESGNTENGNSNMRLALSHVNGTVLEPGQVFSYNDTIGDSTNPENGWLPAGGLSGGVLVQMYGGGICQGSSTLYNAVLRAGLEIVERTATARPPATALSAWTPRWITAISISSSAINWTRRCTSPPGWTASRCM